VSLIEHNVARGDDLVGGEIKAPINLLRRRVAEKDTRGGAMRQFVGSRGTEVWIAQATKDPKGGVIWHLAVKQMIGNTVMYGRGGPPVDQEHSAGKSLNPVGSRHGGMNQKCANIIVQGAKHPFSLAVLGGRVWTRSAQHDAMASQEGSGGIVDELSAIIFLKTAYKTTELCVSISNKLDKMIMHFRLMTKRVRPTVMSIIIN
jgi:hypothetical protein